MYFGRDGRDGRDGRKTQPIPGDHPLPGTRRLRVASIETQLFGPIADRQRAFRQKFRPQQRKLALVRDNLDGDSLAELIQETNKCLEGYL